MSYKEFNSTQLYPAIDNPNVLGRFFDRKRGDKQDGTEDICTYIAIEMPLDPKTKPVIPIKSEAGNEYIKRFPKAWQEYKTGKVGEIDGTPILDLDDDVPDHEKNQGRLIELSRKGYRTIEELAEADEDSIARIGFGFRDIQRRAVARVKKADPKVIYVTREEMAREEQSEAISEKKTTAKCEKCGADFVPYNSRQKYCPNCQTKRK